MSDSEKHQLATTLRKAAQQIEDSGFGAVALIYIDPLGQAKTVSAAQDAGSSLMLLGALYSLQHDHRQLRLAQQAAKRAQAGPTIARPAPGALEMLKKRGEN